MKHIFVALALAASSLSGMCAEAKKPAAAPIAEKAPANVLGPGINAPAYSLTAPADAAWPSELIGTWAGVASASTPAGTMTLSRKKDLTMAPDGMYVLKGFWYSLPGKTLVFDTPLGVVKATYSLSPKGEALSLAFPGGNSQQFHRTAGARASRAVSNDKVKK